MPDEPARTADHDALGTYLLLVFWAGNVALIGMIGHFFDSGFHLWSWLFTGFPHSAKHFSTWLKFAFILALSLVPAIAYLEYFIGIPMGWRRRA